MLKRKPQAPDWCLKPMTGNSDLIPDLISVLTFFRSAVLISESGIFWSVPVRSSAAQALSFPQRKLRQTLPLPPPQEDPVPLREGSLA